MKEKRTEVTATIPVKSLDNAKSRLSLFLTAITRKDFCLKMLEDVLTTVESTNNIDQTVVVSNDKEVFHITKKFNAVFLKERGDGLNQAVKRLTVKR